MVKKNKDNYPYRNENEWYILMVKIWLYLQNVTMRNTAKGMSLT